MPHDLERINNHDQAFYHAMLAELQRIAKTLEQVQRELSELKVQSTPAKNNSSNKVKKVSKSNVTQIEDKKPLKPHERYGGVRNVESV